MKTLQGTITVLKDKEGNIKIPRTTASAVQLVSGKTLDTAIEDIYSKSEIDKMFANLTLNGEITLGSYATKEDLKSKADLEHYHSYNDLTDKPEIMNINDVVSKEYLVSEISKLRIPDGEYIISTLNMKVDVIEGKELSTNDFDNEYKGLLDNYKENLKTVAFTGSYNDLTDTPLVDVTKSYVDALASMKAPLNHEHEQYLSYLPTHAHSDLYYLKSEVNNLIKFASFKEEDQYESLLTDDKTIIGAINELYQGRLTTSEIDINALSVESISSPVLDGIKDTFDYMQKRIDTLEERVRELESLLK